MLANVGLAWTSNDEASPDFRTIEDGKKRWGKIRTATKIAFALQPMPEAPHTSNLPKDELEAREAAAKATPPTSLRQSPSRKLSAALSKSQRSLRKDSERGERENHHDVIGHMPGPDACIREKNVSL